MKLPVFDPNLDELGECSGFLISLDFCGPELAGEFSPATQVFLESLAGRAGIKSEVCSAGNLRHNVVQYGELVEATASISWHDEIIEKSLRLLPRYLSCSIIALSSCVTLNPLCPSNLRILKRKSPPSDPHPSVRQSSASDMVENCPDSSPPAAAVAVWGVYHSFHSGD